MPVNGRIVNDYGYCKPVLRGVRNGKRHSMVRRCQNRVHFIPQKNDVALGRLIGGAVCFGSDAGDIVGAGISTSFSTHMSSISSSSSLS